MWGLLHPESGPGAGDPALWPLEAAAPRFPQRVHPIRYTTLLLSGKLGTYLANLNEQAATRMDLITQQMKEAEGVTEALKRRDMMAWIGAMNSIRDRAEEIVLSELIYC